MFFNFGSVPNAKQFINGLQGHFAGTVTTFTLTGTVKVHGMGVGINISAKGDVTFQTHDMKVDLDGDKPFSGWRDYAKTIEKKFSHLKDWLVDDEFLVISAEFFGGKVQTTGSAAYAPRQGLYIFGVCIKAPNSDFDPDRPEGKGNQRYSTSEIKMEHLKNTFKDSTEIHLSENFVLREHVLRSDISYKDLNEILNNDVKRIEESCPVGRVINPDGNLIAEGFVYTASLPVVPASEFLPGRKAKKVWFKVKGDKHKRKSGNTLTGVDNDPLNAWALESDALSNDRLQQWFDKLHKEDGYVSGLNAKFIELVMADIEKECYVFLDDYKYDLVTPFLIEQSLRAPISKWYKKTLSGEFSEEIKALADMYKAEK